MKNTLVRIIEGADSPTVSNVFANNDCALCVLQITGTYSTATLAVQGLIDTEAGEWTDIAVFDLSNLRLTDKGAKGNGIYTAAVEGILRIRLNLESIADGSLTAVANFR